MQLGWIGVHREGLPALRAVLEAGIPLQCVLTLDDDLAARRSGAADYSELCREFGVRLERVRHINDPQSLELLDSLSLDVAFVIGWSQIVGPAALSRVRLGMIGAHASLLPLDRGRAPINWALIHGCEQTGNSLIWLAADVDSGDIIDQTPIPITRYDTCASLYDRVAESNRTMILQVIPELLAGRRPGHPQPPGAGAPLPGRRPADGALDWSMRAAAAYDFVRALTRPYPGAFGWLDGVRYTIWASALLPASLAPPATPGSVVGPVYSPIPEACGQLVACGDGHLILLELEDEHGSVVDKRSLSERQWTGKVWQSAGETRAGGGGAP